MAKEKFHEEEYKSVSLPLTEDHVRDLRVGDEVRLSGVIVTAREPGHEYMLRHRPPYLAKTLQYGVLYHCGPMVRKQGKTWEVIAAGPSTSMRYEAYTPSVVRDFGIRAIIGKGGLGLQGRRTLRRHGCIYLHAVGGLAAVLAQCVERVVSVHRLREQGTSDAFWLLDVKDFPAVVTMDASGGSLHDQVSAYSERVLREAIGRPR